MSVHAGCAIRIRPVCVWLIAGLLLGCTVNTGYRYADWLLLWKLDRYFDLTVDQKAFLKERLRAFLLWHRKEALPGYLAFLKQVEEKARDGLTRDEVEWAFTAYQHLRAELFERIVPEGVVFLRLVDDRQIRHLERTFQKDRGEALELLEKTAEARLSQRAIETVRLLRDWLGPLTEEQEERISQWSLALPDLQRAKLEYQVHRQQEVLHLLRSRPGPETLTRHLHDWLMHPIFDAPPAYRTLAERMRKDVQSMVLSVDRILTPEQRAHALTKLQDLIDDVHELAAS